MARPPSRTASGNGLARQPTWFTRGRLLLLALLVFILGGVAVALDLKFVTGGKPRPVLPNSLLVLGPKSLETLQNLPGQEAPPHPPVVRGAGLVWTVDTDRNHLLGTNPESGRVVRNVVVGTGPVAVAIGFGSAWVANAENGSITRVSIAGTKVEALGLSDQPSGIATGAGYVWVISRRSKKVLRIDPKINLINKSVRLSQPPLDVVVRGGRVLLTIGD